VLQLISRNLFPVPRVSVCWSNKRKLRTIYENWEDDLGNPGNNKIMNWYKKAQQDEPYDWDKNYGKRFKFVKTPEGAQVPPTRNKTIHNYLLTRSISSRAFLYRGLRVRSSEVVKNPTAENSSFGSSF